MVNNLSKEWIIKNGPKLQKAYNFAIAGKYDIGSEKDVLVILKVVDPENANEEYARMFSVMLQLFQKTFQNKLLRLGEIRKKKIVIN